MSTPSIDRAPRAGSLLLVVLLAGLAGCTGPQQKAAPPTTIDNVNVIRPVREQATAPVAQASASAHVTTVTAAPEKAMLAQQAAGDYFQALQMMKEGRLDDALLVFQQVSVQYPTLSGPLVNQALIYQKKDKPEDAIALLDQALQVNPRNPFALNLRGMLLRQGGKFKEARSAYEQALGIDPMYAKAHFNLGVLADLYLQDLQLALSHYETYQSLQTKPDPAVNNWIADLKNRLGIAAPTPPPAASGPATAPDAEQAPAESAEPQPAPAEPAAAPSAG